MFRLGSLGDSFASVGILAILLAIVNSFFFATIFCIKFMDPSVYVATNLYVLYKKFLWGKSQGIIISLALFNILPHKGCEDISAKIDH